MSLWLPWWNAIWLLRPAFSRLRAFLWFATAVAGFTVRTELLGVTSLVRALNLEPRFCNKLVDHFQSGCSAVSRCAALLRRRARPRRSAEVSLHSSVILRPAGMITVMCRHRRERHNPEHRMPGEIADRDIEKTSARIHRNRMRIVPNIALR
jgi:hypothetical protein